IEAPKLPEVEEQKPSIGGWGETPGREVIVAFPVYETNPEYDADKGVDVIRRLALYAEERSSQELLPTGRTSRSPSRRLDLRDADDCDSRFGESANRYMYLAYKTPSDRSRSSRDFRRGTSGRRTRSTSNTRDEVRKGKPVVTYVNEVMDNLIEEFDARPIVHSKLPNGRRRISPGDFGPLTPLPTRGITFRTSRSPSRSRSTPLDAYRSEGRRPRSRSIDTGSRRRGRDSRRLAPKARRSRSPGPNDSLLASRETLPEKELERVWTVCSLLESITGDLETEARLHARSIESPTSRRLTGDLETEARLQVVRSIEPPTSLRITGDPETEARQRPRSKEPPTSRRIIGDLETEARPQARSEESPTPRRITGDLERESRLQAHSKESPTYRRMTGDLATEARLPAQSIDEALIKPARRLTDVQEPGQYDRRRDNREDLGQFESLSESENDRLRKPAKRQEDSYTEDYTGLENDSYQAPTNKNSKTLRTPFKSFGKTKTTRKKDDMPGIETEELSSIDKSGEMDNKPRKVRFFTNLVFRQNRPTDLGERTKSEYIESELLLSISSEELDSDQPLQTTAEDQEDNKDYHGLEDEDQEPVTRRSEKVSYENQLDEQSDADSDPGGVDKDPRLRITTSEGKVTSIIKDGKEFRFQEESSSSIYDDARSRMDAEEQDDSMDAEHLVFQGKIGRGTRLNLEDATQKLLGDGGSLINARICRGSVLKLTISEEDKDTLCGKPTPNVRHIATDSRAPNVRHIASDSRFSGVQHIALDEMSPGDGPVIITAVPSASRKSISVSKSSCARHSEISGSRCVPDAQPHSGRRATHSQSTSIRETQGSRLTGRTCRNHHVEVDPGSRARSPTKNSVLIDVPRHSSVAGDADQPLVMAATFRPHEPHQSRAPHSTESRRTLRSVSSVPGGVAQNHRCPVVPIREQFPVQTLRMQTDLKPVNVLHTGISPPGAPIYAAYSIIPPSRFGVQQQAIPRIEIPQRFQRGFGHRCPKQLNVPFSDAQGINHQRIPPAWPFRNPDWRRGLMSPRPQLRESPRVTFSQRNFDAAPGFVFASPPSMHSQQHDFDEVTQRTSPLPPSVLPAKSSSATSPQCSEPSEVVLAVSPPTAAFPTADPASASVPNTVQIREDPSVTNIFVLEEGHGPDVTSEQVLDSTRASDSSSIQQSSAASQSESSAFWLARYLDEWQAQPAPVKSTDLMFPPERRFYGNLIKKFPSKNQGLIYGFLVLGSLVGLMVSIIIYSKQNPVVLTTLDTDIDSDFRPPWMFSPWFKENVVSSGVNSPLCLTPACSRHAQRLKALLDETNDPCEDFYGYVCSKGWNRDPRTIVEAKKDVNEQVVTFFKEIGRPDTDLPIATASQRLWRDCVDVETTNKLGRPPLEALLSLTGLSGWPYGAHPPYTVADVWEISGKIQRLLSLSPLLKICILPEGVTVIRGDDCPTFPGNITSVVSEEILRFRRNTSGQRKLAAQVSIFALKLRGLRKTPDNNSEQTMHEVRPFLDAALHGLPRPPSKPIRTGQRTSVTTASLNSLVTLVRSTAPNVVLNYLGFCVVRHVQLLTPAKEHGDVRLSVASRESQCAQLILDEALPVEAAEYVRYAAFKGRVDFKALRAMATDIKGVLASRISSLKWIDKAARKGAITRLLDIKVRFSFERYIERSNTVWGSTPVALPSQGLSTYQKFREHRYRTRLQDGGNEAFLYGRSDGSSKHCFLDLKQKTLFLRTSLVDDRDSDSALWALLQVPTFGTMLTRCLLQNILAPPKPESGVQRTPTSLKMLEGLSSCLERQYTRSSGAKNSPASERTSLDTLRLADNGALSPTKDVFDVYAFKLARTPSSSGQQADNLTWSRVFYVAYAQPQCPKPDLGEINSRRALSMRESELWERVVVPLSNDPAFHETFSCRRGSAMNPDAGCPFWVR
ncbi:unnamed protein product, partial [Ixodes hexagonus]